MRQPRMAASVATEIGFYRMRAPGFEKTLKMGMMT
jgi:hypothetical protein